jgi:hypothetical protein
LRAFLQAEAARALRVAEQPSEAVLEKLYAATETARG